MTVQHDSDRDPAGPIAPGEPAEAEAAPGAAGVSDESGRGEQAETGAEAAIEAEPRDLGAADVMTEARPGHGLPAYRPPPSPAYAEPPPGPVAAPANTPPLATPDDDPPTTERSPSDRRLGWQLLIAGLVLVVVAAVVATLAIRSGRDTEPLAFGEVSAITGDLTVRPGIDDDPQELAVGDEVLAGWQIDLSEGASATIDLAGGGVLRVDSGARLRFVDLAVDPDTGDRAPVSEPAVDLRGGRLWLVPGTATDESAAVLAYTADAKVESDGHPLALDCTDVCTVEAPTGGVTVTTDDGAELNPTTNEVLRVDRGADLALTIAETASAWTRQNVDADERAGLSTPDAGDDPGVVASAVIDGTYAIAITVVGPPAGDPIPTALQYPQGETYALDLVFDGSGCDAPPCSLPVSSDDGLSGTAQLRDGEIELTFGLPINCFDATHTAVVVPGIGTTAVNATLAIAAVDFDGERWHVGRVSGTGTIAATMSTTCNAGDVLGTSTSPITIAGS